MDVSLAPDWETSFNFASKRDWQAMAKDVRPVEAVTNEADAAERLGDC